MIDTSILRKKIIDLAVTGKLTDRSSDDALDELNAIIRGLNNNAQRVITDDEKWADIPSNWTWGRLADLTTNSSLNDGDWVLSKDMVPEGDVKLIQLGSIGDCEYRYKGFKHLTEDHFHELNGKQIYPGYLLINRLVVNKMLTCIIPRIDGILMTAVDVCWVAPKNNIYNLEYIMYAISSSGVQQKVQELGHGVTRFRISKLNLIDIAFPLPPLSEQQQIVDTVNELFNLLKQIDALQRKYASNQGALRSKLIDAAVQGRLTKQLSSDGTAEDLRVDAIKYKDELAKQGILKNRKNKDIRGITDEECLFDLPSSWCWFRLGEVVEVFGRIGFRGYKKDDLVQKGQGAITMSPSNISKNGEVSFDGSTYISWGKYEESPEIMLEEGDIVLVKTGSTYGKCGIIKELPEKATINPQLAILKFIKCNREYLYYVLRSSAAWTQFESFVVGAATPTFSQEKLSNMMIPMPPMAEQYRIVKILDHLMENIK